MQAVSDDMLLSSMRQMVTTQPCGWCVKDALSRLSSVRVEVRVRQIYTWRELAGRTSSSVSDSVQLKFGRDASVVEVTTGAPGSYG